MLEGSVCGAGAFVYSRRSPGCLQGSAPAVDTSLAAQRLAGHAENSTYLSSTDLRTALRACSPAMRRMIYGFFGYAVFNFALFALGFFGGRADEAANLRGFSGH
jgi:hypothetical protein